jgi:glutamate-ammonia-ligase adenylyltransferase
VLAKACGAGDWEAFLANLAQARSRIAQAWGEVFGETLEIE